MFARYAPDRSEPPSLPVFTHARRCPNTAAADSVTAFGSDSGTGEMTALYEMELNAMKKASVTATKMTIRDIGRLAGVSIATVSRVLNEKPDVDADTRARILRIMDEYRFVPSIAGAGLAGGRTGLLGVLAPSLTLAIMSPILSGVAALIRPTSHQRWL